MQIKKFKSFEGFLAQSTHAQQGQCTITLTHITESFDKCKLKQNRTLDEVYHLKRENCTTAAVYSFQKTADKSLLETHV